jgi:hypothetical protein
MSRWIVFTLTAAFVVIAAPVAAEPTERQYLSGVDKDSAVPWEFFCTAGHNSGQWTTIPVPSNWEFQGFGNYSYSADSTMRPVEEGKYRYKFQVPKLWSGKRIFLVFEGSMTDTEVWINGQPAGPKHQGAFYRFKYDITKLVKFGENNLLEATVAKHSSDRSVNAAERAADYWVFGGIFRPVYLEAVPQQFLERLAVDARADGSFGMDVFTGGEGTADEVEAAIYPVVEGKPADKSVATLAAAARAGSPTARLETKVSGSKLWTAETPHLYEAVVKLRSQRAVIHEIRQRFGFRTIEIKPGDGIYVNGTRIMFKGCCRHSFWPDSGRCLSQKISELDVNLIKDMNMNAVRMSHYPPDQHFLDVCDELGLYVLDELGGWQHCYGTEVGRKLVGEMVRRDVNHPSIVLWDNGNEGGWNTELDDDFARWDPQKRQVVHPWAILGPLNTKHYPSYRTLRELLSGREIYFPTEFLHALYDGGGAAGLADFWGLMRASKVSAGGFIWAFLDEGVARTDRHGEIDVVDDKAPDGVVGPYRQKEGSFFAIKEIWSPIVIPAGREPYRGGPLPVENCYEFTNLKECRFTWQLRKFPGPQDDKAGFTVLAEGSVPSPDVPPGKTGQLTLAMPAADTAKADAVALRAVDPRGREVWTWVWSLTEAAKLRGAIVATQGPSATVREDSQSITLAGGGTSLRLGKASGELLGIEAAGKTFSLVNGPRMAIGNATVAGISHHEDGVAQVVEVRYTGDAKSAVWRMYGNGWLRLDYAYELSGPQPYMGVTFDYPEAKLKKLKWLGEGPYRVWKNRMAGTALSVWENAYNDTLTGKQGWVYPEFSGYFGNVRWARLTTDEGPITLVMDQDNLFLRILGKQIEKHPSDGTKLSRKARVDPPFPAGEISILHGIPAIGSKNFTPEWSGPAGQPIDAKGAYKATVWLRFGS